LSSCGLFETSGEGRRRGNTFFRVWRGWRHLQKGMAPFGGGGGTWIKGGTSWREWWHLEKGRQQCGGDGGGKGRKNLSKGRRR